MPFEKWHRTEHEGFHNERFIKMKNNMCTVKESEKSYLQVVELMLHK